MKNKRNIFHSASLRLTLAYLLIIMAVSFVFSFSLYHVAAQEIDHNFRRPPDRIEQMLSRNDSRLYDDFRAAQNELSSEAKSRLKANLLVINLVIAVSGGALSYFLARRSLLPIEEAHDAQSRFISDASHELKTPISAMRIENEIALSDPKLTIKEAKLQLESNIEELDKLTNLSEALLSLSRLDSATTDLSEHKMDALVKGAIKTTQSQFKTKHQKLEADSFKGISVNADAQSITEAIVILLDNASKYSPEKSTIKLKNLSSKDSVKLAIIDSGMGIDEADLSRIFDRFYRADKSRTKNDKQKGYGLGLSIAKATIESHGGTVSAKNNPDSGACFTVTLPNMSK